MHGDGLVSGSRSYPEQQQAERRTVGRLQVQVHDVLLVQLCQAARNIQRNRFALAQHRCGVKTPVSAASQRNRTVSGGRFRVIKWS